MSNKDKNNNNDKNNKDIEVELACLATASYDYRIRFYLIEDYDKINYEGYKISDYSNINQIQLEHRNEQTYLISINENYYLNIYVIY